MKSEHLVGTNIPRFTYDTPTVPENDFYALCEGSRPLCMIFLPGFDHPVSREYITRYLKTLPALKGARLACVVRSSAKAVATATRGSEFPFPVICDGPGVLYGYLGVEQTRGLLSWSFAAQKIYKAAKDAGYHYDKSAPQILPLTLVVGPNGQDPVHPFRPQPDRPARRLRRHPRGRPGRGGSYRSGPHRREPPLLRRDPYPARPDGLG